jgi:hypothetical protein
LSSHSLKIIGTIHSADDESDTGDFYRLSSRLWGALPECISNRNYFHDGVEIAVRANWSSVQFLASEANRIAQASIAASEVGLFRWLESFPTKVEIPVEVAVNGKSDLSEYDWFPSFFVENYLYDVFIILNLALPGVADLMNLRIQRDANKDPSTPIRLASYYLYTAYEQGGEWPYITEIDVSLVESWYTSFRQGISQIPNSPLERAIFAMLHVCRSDGRPEDVVWLFHALESLLQTRVGENFSALVDRLILVLNPNAKQEAHMKSKLREMYNHRSGFVHGGLKIIHPMHNEVMDHRVSDAYDSTIQLSLYGIKLLIACFQHYAKNGWLDVGFRTVADIRK